MDGITGTKGGYSCPQCQFTLYLPIAKLGVSTLGLVDDDRFPGRCLLVLDKHYDHLTELPQELLHAFIDDAVRAVSAIQAVTGLDRINTSILGMVVEHVHWHLHPRRGPADLVPNRPPWEHPLPQGTLPAERRDELIAAIALQLA